MEHKSPDQIKDDDGVVCLSGRIAELEKRNAELEGENERLGEELNSLRSSSRIDALTGLLNRNTYEGEVHRLIDREIRDGRSVGFIFVDVNNLKPVNDSIGHTAGDRVISSVAEVLLRVVRAGTFAARYGGDEFVLVLRDSDLQTVERVCQRIWDAVKEIRIPVFNSTISTSVSVGGVASNKAGITAEELMVLADANMYSAKQKLDSGEWNTAVNVTVHN